MAYTLSYLCNTWTTFESDVAFSPEYGKLPLFRYGKLGYRCHLKLKLRLKLGMKWNISYWYFDKKDKTNDLTLKHRPLHWLQIWHGCISDCIAPLHYYYLLHQCCLVMFLNIGTSSISTEYWGKQIKTLLFLARQSYNYDKKDS